MEEKVKNKKILLSLFVILGSVLCLLICSLSVSAYSYRIGQDAPMDKIVAARVIPCHSFLKNKIVWSEAAHFLMYRNDTSQQDNARKSLFGTNYYQVVTMPNNVMNGSSSNSPVLSCDKFLFGGSTWSGIVQPYIITKDDQEYAAVHGWTQEKLQGVENFITGLGYERDTSGGGGASPDSQDVFLCITPAVDYIYYNTAGTWWSKDDVCFTLVRVGERGVAVKSMEKRETGGPTQDIVFGLSYGDIYGIMIYNPFRMSGIPEAGFPVFPYVGNHNDYIWANSHPSDAACYQINGNAGAWWHLDENGNVVFNCSFESWDDFVEVFRDAEDWLTFDYTDEEQYGDTTRPEKYTLTFLVDTDGRPNNVQSGIRLDEYGEPSFSGSSDESSEEPPLSVSAVYTKKMLAGDFVKSLGFSQNILSFDSHLSLAEVYDLYQRYLANGEYVNVYCGPREDFEGTSSWTAVNLLNDGVLERCYVAEKKEQKYTGSEGFPHNPIMYQGYVNTGFKFEKKNMALSDILNQMNLLSESELEGIKDDLNDYEYNYTEESSYPGGGGEYSPDPCFANAGSFGWVVCPAIDGMAEATDGISGLLNDWLSIDVNLYDGDSGTYDAWGYFRTFANVAIIIVMLVVIFSQLTGVGIDNYGIKKLLPKIIITAILINLSYVICELVIDLSNILGVGLNHLFQSVGRTVDSALSPGQVTQTVVGYLLAGLAGAGALAGSVITIVGAASGGAAMVIVTLILILLTALVAVLLFFMAIGARAIIIILFTAIAPVAVVMYALPNTQGIFKKYINIFKTALVVYPICGGLYGISYVIRGIVFGSGEVPFHMAMVVLCAPYLPFFALPSLTKGALAGLGAVGAAFTALGAGIRNGIGKGRKAAEGTDAYRKGMERGKVGLAARRAQAFKRRDDRRTARGIRNAGDRARFNELNDRINSGQRLSDPEKEEYRRLSGSSSYRRSEAREARYASANETIRAHEDQRGKNRTNSDNLVAAGMLEGDRYKNDKAREEAEGWMDDYLVDSSGNTWIANGNGGYTTVDRSGRSRTVNATQARDMLQNGGRLVSRREAMSGRDRISRADETGRLAAHANSDRVTAAAAGSRLANLETSQSGLREAALSGRDDVIMLQHDKNVDKRRGIIGEAEAYEEFRGLEGASTTISREAARQAAREKLEDVSAKNRVAASYANRLANGDYAPDGGTYDRAAATLDSIRTKAMKGLNQKDTEAMINQVGEVGVDLNVARANAQSASNTTAGKQQAMAEFLREGRDVVTSVNAARQAAETQLAGTVGQNLSADDYENKVNSGVYDRTEVRNNAIEAARIKNINQTTNTIESNAAGEVEVNREVARTNAMSAHNAAVGKQDATMNFINEYGQDRVATSVSAARQAAETQLAGTVGQNLAATVYDERVSQGEYNPSEVRRKAVDTQTVKAINQTINTIESNAVGEAEITPEYARSVAQSRFDTTQQRMYSEQLSNNTRNQSLADLAGALVGADGTVGTIKGTAVGGEHMNSDQVNYVIAAIKDVMAKGGVEDLNRLIMNASGTIAAKPELAEAIYSEMATMSVEPEMKAYGKYAMGKIEKIKNGERNVTMLDYDGWLNAADNAGDLDGKESLAGYIRANGDTVLVGASKDTFKFYEGDGDLTNKFSPTQVLKGALSARDGETRVAANKMLRRRIGSDDAALTQAINGITISQWANMESGTLNALMGNHIDNPGQVSGDLKASLEEVGRKLKGSGPTVKANIRPEVKAYFKQLGIDIDIKGKS